MVTVTVDDALPAIPGNLLVLPAAVASLWRVLTMAERNAALAGRGDATLVATLRALAVCEDEHGF